jgi:hypothetical protein
MNLPPKTPFSGDRNMSGKKVPVTGMILFLAMAAGISAAAEKTIGVFVALADNASQGIVPVPAAIGDGNDPERNLYWGTAEGLKGVFKHS